MLERILVPSDLSKTSNSVLPYALTLGQTFDSKVYLVHVMDPDEIGRPEKLEAFPRVSTFFELDRTRDDLPPLKPFIPIGKFYQYHRDPESVILRFARKKKVDLICMASTDENRRLAWWSAGELTDAIIRRAHCSVFCLRGKPVAQDHWTRPRFQNVLLLVDIHQDDDSAFTHALPLVNAYRSMLHVYPLVENDELPDPNPLHRVAELGADQANVLLFANPRQRLRNLTDFVRQTPLDLIIMPAAIRTKLSLPFIRDVLVKLMGLSEAPILILR